MKAHSVTYIEPAETVQVDQDRLGALYAEMGPISAEDVVCRAMEELAVRMAQCDRLYRADDLDGLFKSSRSEDDRSELLIFVTPKILQGANLNIR